MSIKCTKVVKTTVVEKALQSDKYPMQCMVYGGDLSAGNGQPKRDQA